MNRRQELFVAEYLVSRNATDAARKAGYSENRAKQTGSELLRKPHIAAAISKADKERQDELGVDADSIVAKALAVYEKAFNGAPKVTREGKPITVDGVQLFDWNPTGAMRALELLVKITGVGGAEKHELIHSGEVVYTLTLDRQLPEVEDDE